MIISLQSKNSDQRIFTRSEARSDRFRMFCKSQSTAPFHTHVGFTLVELLVSISIVILVMGIVLFKYATLNNVILLKSQAYEIALDIRNAQEAGVSVQADGSTGFNSSAYGIQLQKSTQTYTLYQSVPSNILATYTLDQRFKILAICDSADSFPPYSNCLSTSAQISFQRPDFTAHMSDSVHNSTITSLSIVIASVNDPTMTRIVQVTQTGQISVQ